MKKQLFLSLALCSSMGLVAQTVYTVSGAVVPKVDPALANKGVEYKGPVSEAYQPSFQSAVNKLIPKNHNNNNNPSRAVFAKDTIGTSIYDLQTNASVCNRIILNTDGTISATWTMDHGSDPATTPNRGTGYNYFDGTNWIFGAAALPTMLRLENVRVGWPNIGVTNMGSGAFGEVIVSHEASANPGNIHVLSRPAKGTGAWTDNPTNFTDTWPRMVVGGANGKTIHLISQTSGAAPTKPPFMGQDGAITYSRSLDGGVTWDKLHTVIPQIDSSNYLGFTGDDYAIDAKGDVIVIVAGGAFLDVVMVKSTDNGNTWTKTIVNKFPIPLYNINTMISDTSNPKDGIPDNIQTNDGSLAVLLDNQGKAHVWFGNMVVRDTVAAGTNYTYFPFTDGLMYWNENMGNKKPVMIAAAQDLDNNGKLSVFDRGTYGGSGLTSMPSAGIDASGSLFVSYGSVFEGVSDDGTGAGPNGSLPATGKSYRHTYLTHSDDGGITWCTPRDITDPDYTSSQYDYLESVFGAVAKRVDNNVHLIYQQDGAPGNGLTGTPPGSTDPQSGNEANIIYVKIPVADLACSAIGIKENTEAVSNVSLYPNPATTTATLSFTVAHPAKVDIAIYNAIGQNIATFSNQLTVAGTHTLNINTANYKQGIYFVNSTINGKKFSQKLVIE